MNCPQMVPTYPEQILNRTVDREESLSLLDRFEPSHLPLLFSGVLVRNFSPAILILTGSTLRKHRLAACLS